MFTPMSLLLGSIHTVTALMVLSLAILLYRGWLPGNGPYYKFVSLMEDDYDMMQLSRYIGRMYVIWSLLYLTTAAVILFWGLGDFDPLIPWFAFGPILFMIIPGLLSWLYACRLKADANS